MPDDLNELYQEVILDHSKNPKNFAPLDDANRMAQGRNPVCGDQVTIFMNVEEGVIKDITFQGSGCAISKAAASMMTSSLKGKSIAEAKTLFDKVQEIVTTGEGNLNEVGKLAAFAGVHKFPARVKCAMLPWRAAIAAMEHPEIKENVTTE
jgi:nitrogen fixation NifU-like protein